MGEKLRVRVEDGVEVGRGRCLTRTLELLRLVALLAVTVSSGAAIDSEVLPAVAWEAAVCPAELEVAGPDGVSPHANAQP